MLIPFKIPIINSLVTFDEKLFSVKSLVAMVLTVTANVCIPALPPLNNWSRLITANPPLSQTIIINLFFVITDEYISVLFKR